MWILNYIFFSYMFCGIWIGLRLAKADEKDIKEYGTAYFVVLFLSPIIFPVMIGVLFYKISQLFVKKKKQ